MTRRELLKSAAVGILVMGWRIPALCAQNRVVILGSTIASLTCARYLRLYDDSADVTVLAERRGLDAFDDAIVYKVKAIATGDVMADTQLQHWFGKEAAREIAAALQGKPFTPNLPYCGVAFGSAGENIVRYDLKSEGSEIVMEKVVVESNAAMVALRHCAVHDDVYM